MFVLKKILAHFLSVLFHWLPLSKKSLKDCALTATPPSMESKAPVGPLLYFVSQPGAVLQADTGEIALSHCLRCT